MGNRHRRRALSEETGTSLVIAIDGPSGSGKSSAARGVARRLGLRFLDTGAMYRAACWSVIEDGLDPGAAASVARLVRDLDLTIGTDPDHPTVAVNGIDVSDAIRRARNLRVSEQNRDQPRRPS